MPCCLVNGGRAGSSNEYAHAVMMRDGFGPGHTHAFRLMEVKLQNKAFDAIYGRKRSRSDE